MKLTLGTPKEREGGCLKRQQTIGLWSQKNHLSPVVPLQRTAGALTAVKSTGLACFAAAIHNRQSIYGAPGFRVASGRAGAAACGR